MSIQLIMHHAAIHKMNTSKNMCCLQWNYFGHCISVFPLSPKYSSLLYKPWRYIISNPSNMAMCYCETVCSILNDIHVFYWSLCFPSEFCALSTSLVSDTSYCILVYLYLLIAKLCVLCTSHCTLHSELCVHYIARVNNTVCTLHCTCKQYCMYSALHV